MPRCVLPIVALCAGCGRHGFELSSVDSGSSTDGDRSDTLSSYNVAFVTAGTYVPGQLGGLAAADAICQTEAEDAALPGAYVAWLSTTAEPARGRIAGSRGWVRADATPFVDTVDDLIALRLFAPLEVLPDGRRDQSGTKAVTATAATGMLEAMNCVDYTTTTGSTSGGIPHALGEQWTADFFTITCGTASKLYCFGVGHTLPVSPTTVSGRRAFLTSVLWPPGNGLADADSHCQARASAAGLTGTFRAMLATQTASAASRFSDGPPWIRLDGIAIAPTALALLGNDIHVPPLDDAGRPPDSFDFIWLGADTFGDVGSQTCSDWMSSAAGQTAISRAMSITTFDRDVSPCNAPHPLFCLEP